MRGSWTLVLALAVVAALAGCAEPPPPISAAPAYKAPPPVAGQTASVGNTVRDPGPLAPDYWAFVAKVDGYPVAQTQGSLDATVLAAGSHILAVGCATGEHSFVVANLQLDVQADHDYAVECDSLGSWGETYALSIRDLTTHAVVAQDSATKAVDVYFFIFL